MKKNNNIYTITEELFLSAWPALHTQYYDGWVLRFSDGYTKRSNSVSPIHQSSICLDDKIEFCEKQYDRYQLPTIFKISPGSMPEGIDQKLEERGYVKADETSVRLLSIEDQQYQLPEGILVESGISESWIQGFFGCSNVNENDKSTSRKIHEAIVGETIFISKLVDGNIVGCGYGVIQNGYVSIYDIVVNKAHREKGYGKDIIEGLLNMAYIKGVKIACLAVVVGNTPAEKLYDKFAFQERYRYWYRVKC